MTQKIKHFLICSGLLILPLLFTACNKGEYTPPTQLEEGSFSMKIDGKQWNAIGSALWDVNSGGVDNSVLVLTAGDEDNPEFSFVVEGTVVQINKPIPVYDGEFVPHIVFTHINVDYDTQFGNTGLIVGYITFTSINDNTVTGTFDGTLSSENGKKITLTEGKFNVLLKKF